MNEILAEFINSVIASMCMDIKVVFSSQDKNLCSLYIGDTDLTICDIAYSNNKLTVMDAEEIGSIDLIEEDANIKLVSAIQSLPKGRPLRAAIAYYTYKISPKIVSDDKAQRTLAWLHECTTNRVGRLYIETMLVGTNHGEIHKG